MFVLRNNFKVDKVKDFVVFSKKYHYFAYAEGIRTIQNQSNAHCCGNGKIRS